MQHSFSLEISADVRFSLLLGSGGGVIGHCQAVKFVLRETLAICREIRGTAFRSFFQGALNHYDWTAEDVTRLKTKT